MADEKTIAEMWAIAAGLQGELPALHDDIIAKWEEFSQLLEDGTEGADGHAKRKAMYLSALALQGDLMGRLIALKDTTGALKERYTRLDATRKMKVVSSALAIENIAGLLKTLRPETLAAFRADGATMSGCVEDWQLTAASAMVAAFSGWRYFRDMLYAYLHQQTLFEGGFIAAVALVKNVAVDVVAKANPFIGPVLALAEVVKSNTERRIEEAAQARTEIDLIFSLEDAIADGLSQATEAEKIVRDALQHFDRLEVTFNQAASRTRATLELLAR